MLRLDVAEKMQLYNEMIDRYSHPFFMVRQADLFLLLKADSLAVDLYRKVRAVVFVYFDLASHHPGPSPLI